MFLLTVWIIRRRFTRPPDWNLALGYYFALVLYARSFEGLLSNNVIFIGTVVALFIRFEFLGKHFFNAFRFMEFLLHAYVLVITFQVLFFNR